MSSASFSTVGGALPYRYMPRELVASQAKQLQDSGVVDYILLGDQMMSWWPPSLWNAKNAPLAAAMPDADSFVDPIALAGYVAAHAPGLGIMATTDAVRHGPAELMRSVLTLASLTEGRFTLLLGAGEVKQTKPFGWKRSQGFGRLEDHLRLYRKLWSAEEPFDFKGNYWNFDTAWLGGAKTYQPDIWTIGGGPRLIDLSTSYANGLATAIPGVWSSPEKTAKRVGEMKEQLRHKGRDASDYGFAPMFIIATHTDESVIDRFLDNPLARFMTAVWGRLHMPDWRDEGIEPPFPDDWHYANRLLSHNMSATEVDDVLSKVTREMVEKSYIFGTPAKVADELQRYIDAGMTRVMPANMASLVADFSEMEAGMSADIELLRILKEKNASSPTDTKPST